MQLQRHGWDIHALSAEPDRSGGQESRVTAACQERSSITSYGLGRCRPPTVNVNPAALS